jgi:hypothetical protein
MPLKDVTLSADAVPLPADVRAFLREAERRIERFQMTSRCPGFVPGDYVGAYSALHAVATSNLTTGNRFCEWGSGFGVITCLAAMLDFDACGIDIEPDLVDAARQLAEDFDLPVEFVRDSFIPAGGERCVDAGGAYSWLTTDAGDAHNELDLTADDFDVIYAYPWPDEEEVTGDLFQRFAAVGALLVTNHVGDGFRVRRKVAPKRGRAGKARGR